jgi:hypothetical protein
MHIDDLPIPEEMKEAIRNTMAQQQMTVESFRHDVQRLFEELKMEHLLTLRHLFSHLMSADDGRYAAYLEGTAAATLFHRFHVCPSCGKDHDKELLETSMEVDGGTQHSIFDKEVIEVENADDRYRRFLQTCRDYGVRIPEGERGNIEDPNKTPVVCMNCGTKYVSLEDRMIKPPGPENCEGCVNKTKWG